MLRRVSRALRMLLIAVGILLLLWLPMSFLLPAADEFHGEERVCRLSLRNASGMLVIQSNVLSWMPSNHDTHHAFIPWIEKYQSRCIVHVPLWLLAAICLAWPVTSFVVARRRRRGRGFEVRTEVRDQKSEVSPASGAPKVLQEPEPGASPRVDDGSVVKP